MKLLIKKKTNPTNLKPGGYWCGWWSWSGCTNCTGWPGVGPGGAGTSGNSGPGCWIPSVGKTPEWEKPYMYYSIR